MPKITRDEAVNLVVKLLKNEDPGIRRSAEAARNQLSGAPVAAKARDAIRVAAATPRRSKYGNKAVLTPLGRFESHGEYNRWIALLGEEWAGLVIDLLRQITIPLVEGTESERPVSYKADFLYVDMKTGRLVVEDFKGFETAAWKIKRKLFREKYPNLELRITKKVKKCAER